jgi:hypothetical protein
MADRAPAPPRRGLAMPWRERQLPLHPLLIAAWPVLFLYGANIGELSLADLVGPLAAIVGAALALLVVGAYVLRDGRRAALIVSALAAALLLYGHVAGLLGPLGLRAAVLQVGWLLLIATVAVVAVRIGTTRLAGLTRALDLVAAVLVVVALVTIVPAEVGRFGPSASAATGPGSTPVIAGADGTQRDIYFLIFDRYGSARTLDLQYGIDDRPFLDGLRARGFQVAPDSHANYVKTTLSLAATLNLDYLDDIVAEQGPDSEDHGPIFEHLSDHAVGHFLRDRGYQYVHVGSRYGPTESSVAADRNLRLGGPSDFAAALYDNSALPAISRRLGLTKTSPERSRQYDVGRFQLNTLDELASEPAPGPVFVFAHLLLPHPPYVFTSDGSFVSDDVDADRSQRDGYAEQLVYINKRIDALVDRLLDRPEAEQPIIILQADEGPYPPAYARNTITYDWATASSEELEIKYGILDAMYLPGAEAPDLPPSMSSVNTFRLVLGAYFGADLPLLPDRSFTSASKLRPYDLTDITDRLAEDP